MVDPQQRAEVRRMFDELAPEKPPEEEAKRPERVNSTTIVNSTVLICPDMDPSVLRDILMSGPPAKKAD